MEAKHNESEGYRQLKRLTEGTSVFSTYKTTTNTKNVMVTHLTWFITFAAVTFKELKTTAKTHAEYLHRLGTTNIFGLQ